MIEGLRTTVLSITACSGALQTEKSSSLSQAVY